MVGTRGLVVKGVLASTAAFVLKLHEKCIIPLSSLIRTVEVAEICCFGMKYVFEVLSYNMSFLD